MTPQAPEPFFAEIYLRIGQLLSSAGFGPLAVTRMLGRPGQPLPQFIKVARLATINPYGRAAKQYEHYRQRAMIELEHQPPVTLKGDWAEGTLVEAVATIATADLRPAAEPLALELVEPQSQTA